ncbi:family 43 glycosylhydrolase [Rhodococcus oxybenzonivorans]|uniref:family 43 glycosylhydrolase n=1 Tax=Rhodococcus oxybenzonivorans TaxID=1990687 RepID=UPI002955979E|nr:family 43 glycosylhydrolase [Rhodococcus oxybenzonivorans]MDV7356470.1 family 43 glycosylhydrolase [Rhodococcus oxybenzonivorans]
MGRRRLLRRGWIVTTLTLLALMMVPASPVAANPVVEPVAADPSVVRAADGMYYMYTTADDWGDGQGMHNMSMFKSFDLMDWMYVGDVFPDLPEWHPEGKLAWAPHVLESGGGYSLYYSLYDESNPCIGLATAPGATGPWTDLGRPVFCAQDVGIEGTIDPFVWDDGTSKTMVVGNFRGIYAIPLDGDGAAPVGEPVQIADDRFEGPFITFRNGYYHLFLSAGNCCNGGDTAYRVVAGRSRSLTGPYLDRKGQDLNEGGGALILAGSDPWAGPGHNTVVTDDAGNDWIVYHAIPRDDVTLPSGAQRREGMIDRIVWADGWPDVGDGSPSSTRPQLPDTDLPVRVSLTADDSTTLHENGGTIAATMVVAAPEDQPYAGQVWASVTSPDGGISDPIFGPIDVDLAAGEVYEEPISYAVSADAPNGTYDVYAFAGIFDTDTVEFGALNGVKSGPQMTDVAKRVSAVVWRDGA